MGAVSHVMGVEGSTYRVLEKDGDAEKVIAEYELSGWTLGAIAAHEQFLEKRAGEAILRMPPGLQEAATAALGDRITTFQYSYGGTLFTNSLKSFEGLGHFFWQLAKPKNPKMTLAQAVALVKQDPEGTSTAVHEADPQNRATAEANPKAEGEEPPAS